MSYAGPSPRTNRAPDAPPAQKAARRAPGDRPIAAAIRAPRNRSASDDWRGPVLLGAGVALGVVVGASLALLFAPQAGADTRRSIARRSQRLGRRGHDAWDDLRIELGRAVKRRFLTRHRDRADRTPDAD